VLLHAVLQTNVLSVAATPKLDYVVGGCMDSCVHIWKFEQPVKGAADKEGEGVEGAADGDEEEEGTKLIEYSCGGYMTKVRGFARLCFGKDGPAWCLRT
jgi:hypothetical protein